MDVTEIVLRIIAGVVLVGVNAFFVAIEFSLTRLRQFPAEDFEDDPRLQRAWEMTDELEIYLTGCQLGISLSSIVLGVVAEPAVTLLFEPLFELMNLSAGTASLLSITFAIVLIQLAHKIWGEQTPTYLGVERPKAVARWLAAPLYWWSKVMYPLIYAGDSLAKGTLRLFGVEMTRSWTGDGAQATAGTPEFRKELMDVLAGAELGRERRQEIVNTYDLGEQTARDIMVPRDAIVALQTDLSLDENLDRLRSHGFTRFPLVGSEVEEFHGVIYLSAVFARYDDLQRGRVSLRDICSDPVCVPEDTPIDEVIDILQEAREELALVVAGDDVVGLLTATDAFEAIIGELEDPLD